MYLAQSTSTSPAHTPPPLLTPPLTPASDPARAPTIPLDDRDLGAAFPALLRGLTTKDDVQRIAGICRRIMGDDSDRCNCLLSVFYEELVDARSKLPTHVLAMERTISDDWYKSPWYVTYVQYLGVENDRSLGTFDTLRKMIPYIRERLGFKNVLLLPHYESPMADGGFDVSAYEVRESLGGTEAFKRFMDDAHAAGLRIATDAVFNHTSTQHDWFQRAIAGEQKYQRYYVQRNGREKIDEWEHEGEVWCKYRDANGIVTERAAIFPDIDRTHGLWVEIGNETFQFYRTFHPFQVDLNLQNIDVLRELFRVIASEVQLGVLGKRLNASMHWVKKPGVTHGQELDECHALHALFKQFIRHLHRRAVLFPEVVCGNRQAVCYAGESIRIGGVSCAAEGDAIPSFEMQAALREAIYLQTVVPFWRRVFEATDCLSNAHTTWLNFIEHHDALYLGFHPRSVRRWIAYYITSHNGVLGRNGSLGAGRLADAVRGNEQRLIASLVLLFLCPGTPMVYAGTEILASSNWDHAHRHCKKRTKVFNDLGVYTDESALFDLRELHRGALPYSRFEDAVNNHLAPFSAVKRLNAITEQFPHWWSTPLSPVMVQDVTHILSQHQPDSHEVSVLVGVKQVNSAPLQTPVLCVVNLSHVERSIKLPANQVHDVLCLDRWAPAGDFSLSQPRPERKQEVFKNQLDGRDVVIECDTTSVYLLVEAFGCLLLTPPANQ